MPIQNNLPAKTAVIVMMQGFTKADAILMDFEGFADGTSAVGAYAAQGVTFSSGTIFKASSSPCSGSLYDVFYPPYSGCGLFKNDLQSVVTTTITFATPITSFRGHFTYSGPIFVEFFNAADVSLRTLTGVDAMNLGGGVGAGSPNETFWAPVLANATRIVTTADSVDFTMDDVSVETVPGSAVPEPGTIGMMLTAAAVIPTLGAWRRRRARRRHAEPFLCVKGL